MQIAEAEDSLFTDSEDFGDKPERLGAKSEAGEISGAGAGASATNGVVLKIDWGRRTWSSS